MTDLGPITPVRCPEPNCRWTVHGIPDKYADARARYLAEHHAGEHVALPAPAARITLTRSQLAVLLAHHADVIAARWFGVAPSAGAWEVAAAYSLRGHAAALSSEEETPAVRELLDSIMSFNAEQLDKRANAELHEELDYWHPDGGDEYGTPVHWTVYNEMHKRAAAEAEATRMRAGWAGVMRQAAMITEGLRQFEDATGARTAAQVSENVGVLRVATELRRIAEETRQADTAGEA